MSTLRNNLVKIITIVTLTTLSSSANAFMKGTLQWQQVSNTASSINYMLGSGGAYLIKDPLLEIPTVMFSVSMPDGQCQLGDGNRMDFNDFRVTLSDKYMHMTHRVYTMDLSCMSTTTAVLAPLLHKDNEELIELIKNNKTVELFWNKDDRRPVGYFNTQGFSNQVEILKKTHDKKYVEEYEQAQQRKKTQYKDDNELFFEQKMKEPGVVSTTSGLLYRIVKSGQGKQPSSDSTVTVNYVGSYFDGTEFSKGEPSTFELDKLTKGLSEGIQLMTVGSMHQFIIPAKLAFGSSDTGSIPGNSVLVFDVELIEIEK